MTINLSVENTNEDLIKAFKIWLRHQGRSSRLNKTKN